MNLNRPRNSSEIICRASVADISAHEKLHLMDFSMWNWKNTPVDSLLYFADTLPAIFRLLSLLTWPTTNNNNPPVCQFYGTKSNILAANGNLIRESGPIWRITDLKRLSLPKLVWRNGIRNPNVARRDRKKIVVGKYISKVGQYKQRKCFAFIATKLISIIHMNRFK